MSYLRVFSSMITLPGAALAICSADAGRIVIELSSSQSVISGTSHSKEFAESLGDLCRASLPARGRCGRR